MKAYNDKNSGFISAENIDEFTENILWSDVLVIGPGIGRSKESQEAVIKILRERKFKKIVVDADAIYSLQKGRYKGVNLKNVILTPHHGEFANLIGISVLELKKDTLKYGRSFTKRTGAYLVFKNAPTIIFTPTGDALINSCGNPGLAKFGTGDVLTGLIAGLLSQQNDTEKAIIGTVYIHSFAADLLVPEKTEYSLMAEDLINYIPDTINFLRNSFV